MNNLNKFLTTGELPATHRERVALLDSARAKILSLNTMQLFPTPNGEPMNAAEFFKKAAAFEKLRVGTPIFEAAKKAVAPSGPPAIVPKPALPSATRGISALTGLAKVIASFKAQNASQSNK